MAWWEVDALQLGCAVAGRRRLEHALSALREVRLGLSDRVQERILRSHEAAALLLADEIARYATAGDLGRACGAALRAYRLVDAAMRHVSLLPTASFALDTIVTVYAPLLLPLAASVGSTLWPYLGARNRNADRRPSL